MDEQQKQLKNLFKKLINNQNSVFYAADKINNTLLNKGRRSSYEKDKVFYKIFNTIEDRNIIYEDDDESRIPFYTPFVEQKKDIDRSSTLYTVNAPLQFFHTDVAFLKFFAKSAVDPKYALICVDLFSSKVYVYTMRKKLGKRNFWQKLEILYKEIDSKRRNKNKRMRLQTDLEFQQNDIKKLNKKYNVEMFSSRTRGGKAFAAEQKIREFKTLLFKRKRLHKTTKKTRLDSKKIIKKTVENMNKINSQKYGFPPETIEKKALSDNVFQEIYDFHRIVRVSKDAARYKRYDIRLDKKRRKQQLPEPLVVGEKVLVLAERIKKKDTPGRLFKSITKNIPFFNRKEIFIVRKVVQFPIQNNSSSSSYNYWISKSSEDEIIERRFLRQELFALKNQFE